MKKFFALIFVCLINTSTWAYDVELDGIFYNLDKENKTAEVTFKLENRSSYSGDVIIPTSFLYNNEEYTVTSIGDKAFYMCTGLKSVSLSNTICKIGNDAFNMCINLKLDTLPNSVKTVGNSAFEYCFNIINFKFPNSVTSIGERAFYFSNLSSISLPDSIIRIEKATFEGCKHLSTIDIPITVKYIDQDAFYACELLNMLSIPNSVENIGYDAFNGCCNLKSIVVESNNSNYDSRENCNALIETKTNKLILGCQNTIIPSTIDSIGRGAFVYCKSLTSITIPNSVINIDYMAFSGTGLSYIYIPESVKYIGDAPFCGCSDLKSIVVQFSNKNYDSRDNCNAIIRTEDNTLIQGCSKTIIPEGIVAINFDAFYHCNELISINIPSSVKLIDMNAFYECSELKNISRLESVTDIGKQAFYGCSKLLDIEFSDNLKNIENLAFFACINLSSLNIPNSVIYIGHDAFCNCEKVKYITIGNSVKTIGEGCFQNCFQLKTMILKNPVIPSLEGSEESVFISSNIGNATLYVPVESIDIYRSTAPWSEFGTILPIESTNINDVKFPTPKNAIYNIYGQKAKDSDKGILIRDGKKYIYK